MKNLTKYKISYFFESLFFAITFLCMGCYCISDDVSWFCSSLVWFSVYTMHYFCFSSKYFNLVYKKIDNEKESKQCDSNTNK